MRLVCLECSAAYEAPDDLFGPEPREVRCNRCGYQWSVVKPAATAAEQADETHPAPPPAAASPVLASPAPEPPPAPVSEPAPPPPAPVMNTGNFAPSEPRRPTAPTAAPVSRPGSSRLADALAGTPQPDPARAPIPAPSLPTPEPAAASTRSLLGDVPADEVIAPPDPEERRLSHELAFEQLEPRRRSDGSRLSRRLVGLIIMLVIVIIIAAIVFKPQIVMNFPGMGGVYAAIGL